jgi:MoaA/NifB/PqqE/SkfB family radical SAM enzyme
MKSWTFSIDIVGTCNLRCPSCPVGNAKQKNPSGLMDIEMFKTILDKIAERNDIFPKIDLYNWGEPSLHPKLPEFIRAINDRGWYSCLSSNFNTQNIERLVEVAPKKIRLSVSGFNQNRYGSTHSRGDISKVLSNWYKLVHAIRKRKLESELEVAFHVYRDNKDDLIQWASLAAQSGARLTPVWSIFQPMEDLIEISTDDRSSATYSDIANLMEVDPLRQLSLAKQFVPQDCRLRYRQTAINWDGSVALCCAVYDASKFTIAPSFTDSTWEQLQKAKYAHKFCEKCFAAGGPGLLEQATQTAINQEAIANQRVRSSENIVSLQNGLNIDGKLNIQRIFFSHLNSNAN